MESANEAVRQVAASLGQAGSLPLVEAAFLEGGVPDLRGAMELLAERGAGGFVILPYFLTLGLHMKRDLPRLIEEVRQAHPEYGEITVAAPLDGHPALTQILLDRAEAACRQHA